MATVYTELRKETNKRGEAAIRIVIVVGSSVSRLASGYRVAPKYWDAAKLRIKPSHPHSVEYNAAIDRKVSEIRARFAQMDAAGKSVSARKFTKAVSVGDSFFAISGHFAERFRAEGKIGTADRYNSIANQIEKMYPKIRAVDMDADWAEDFRSRLKAKEQTHNTIVGKLTNIRAILTKAVSAGFIAANPMTGIVVGSFHEGDKQALTLDEIEKLWNFRCKGWAAITRAAFLFSYYTTGARFRDVLLMPKSALYNAGKRLKWIPSKTKDAPKPKVIDVEVSPRLAEIIREMDNPTSTIFGLVDPSLSPAELEKRVDVIQASIRGELKNVIAKAGIGKYITFHCARVTFIRLADEVSNREVLTIKDAVGHSDSKTTIGYIGKNQRAIDKLTRALYGNAGEA